MTGPFGVNVLSPYVRDRQALLDWLQAAQPAACVVMDDSALTQQVRAVLPKSTVIHRAYNPNDHRWWEVVSPAEWLTAHVGFSMQGVYVQLLNEPVLNDAALAWLEGVCKLCPPDVRLALPNFAVGNPNEQDILAGKYDRLLRLVCGTRHILACHEYFKDDPVAEVPYLCGRFAYWQRRARGLGLPEPRIVITEHGRDVGGGRKDGWRDTGWSEQDYFARLEEAQVAVYDNTMPVCVFCWGTGANNDWASFDLQDAGALQYHLFDWNHKHPIQQPAPAPLPVPPTPPQLQPGVIQRVAAVYVNVRLQPTTDSTILRRAYPGSLVQYDPRTVEGGEYNIGGVRSRQWVALDLGYVAAGAVTITPDETRNPIPSLDKFIDVSSNNGGILWERAYADGVREAYIRATMGGAGVDTRWQDNAAKATRAGVTVGFYHLFRPDSEGVAQAYHFLRAVKGVIALPLAVDVERVVAPLRDLTKAQYADQLAAFARVMQAETGELPLIYTSYGEWGALVGRQHDALFAQCACWVANYTSRPQPTLPRCWKTYWQWQYSNQGRVDGIIGRVDLNRRRA